MMKRIKIPQFARLFILFILLSLAPVLTNAQTHYDETGTDDGGVVQDSPVDGGVVVLLVAGASLGAIKLYQVKHQKKINKMA